MSELEDKINNILSSPEEMEKIMGLARSLSGSADGPTPQHEAPIGEVSAADPRIMRMVTKLIGEYTKHENDKSDLLTAMKPYLREERRRSVDQAAELVRLTHMARLALSEWGNDRV